MSVAALIKEGHAGSDAEIREWMSGNIYRCGALLEHRCHRAASRRTGLNHAGIHLDHPIRPRVGHRHCVLVARQIHRRGRRPAATGKSQCRDPTWLIDLEPLPMAGTHACAQGLHLEPLCPHVGHRRATGRCTGPDGAVSGLAGIGVTVNPQHGDLWRQSAATHRRGYLRDTRLACNKRQPGSGCPRSTGRTECTLSWASAIRGPRIPIGAIRTARSTAAKSS